MTLEDELQEREIARIDNGGDAWDGDEVSIEPRPTLDKVVPVRLSADTWQQLRRLAVARGLGPTTLLRMWVLERLKLEKITPPHSTSVAAPESMVPANRLDLPMLGDEDLRRCRSAQRQIGDQGLWLLTPAA